MKGVFLKKKHQYFLGLTLPLLVTVIAGPMHRLIPAENVALIYIVAVIVTAVNTGTRPAMLAAFVSFITFNFFFTNPKYTLLVLHPPDVLTIILFVLTAVLVGHLAARLREKLGQLQAQEHFSNIELQFMEKLAVAIYPREVLDALADALASIANLEFQILRIDNGRIDFSAAKSSVSDATQELLQRHVDTLHSAREPQSLGEAAVAGHLLTDGVDNIALIATRRDPATELHKASIELLLRQANLALGRTRLVWDLESERLEREQEVMRSSLLSSVSHDFRTPLTAMIGAASTLIEMGSTLEPAQQKELLGSILDEAIRLNGYTQKLLDMTRLGHGELTLHRSTVSIDEIINVVIKRFRHQAQAERLVLDIESHLPLLDVHAALIEQALYNVIENSLKFSPPESPIVIRVRMQDKSLCIEVEDSGPGIPATEREKVFEMFHSADRGDRRAAGSGLGLAICKGMIGAHGGTVEIQDPKSGKGCLVRIVLPVSEDSD